MEIQFSTNGWDDYLYWQKQDRKTLKRINKLIRDACRDPVGGIGKPEALSHTLQGFWSRRITAEHRLVYKVENGALYILQCRYHY